MEGWGTRQIPLEGDHETGLSAFQYNFGVGTAVAHNFAFAADVADLQHCHGVAR